MIDEINRLIDVAIQREATDIHFIVGKPPILRINGDLILSDSNIVNSEQLKKMMFGMLNDQQKDSFLKNKELDFSYSCLNDHQARINLHFERGNIASNIRIIPSRIKSMEELNLPSAIKSMILKRKGLIVVSGPAGNGKTTTLTWMIDKINSVRKCKIITIEDPIEYVHSSKSSLIIQREVGFDTLSFSNALKYALRQDPDIVVIGEMRDLESISMALTTAETGHLVLTTLHSPDAIETINRIIDVYPSVKHEQVCLQLSENLVGIIGQVLLPHKTRKDRILATEVLYSTRAVRNLIRGRSIVELRGQLDSDVSKGMHTFEKCMSYMVKNKEISREIALEYAKYPDLLQDL